MWCTRSLSPLLVATLVACGGDGGRCETPSPAVMPVPVAIPTGAEAGWRPCPLDTDEERHNGWVWNRVMALDGCRVAGFDDVDGDGTDDRWEARFENGDQSGTGSWRVSIERSGGPGLVVTDAWSVDQRLRTIDVPSADPAVALGVARLLVDERWRPPAAPSIAMVLARAEEAAAGDVVDELPGGLWLRTPRDFPLHWVRRRPVQPASEALILPAAGGHTQVVALDPPTMPAEPLASCRRWEIWASSDVILVRDRRDGRWAWLAVEPYELAELGGMAACGGDLVFVLRAPGHGNDTLVFDLAHARTAVLDRTDVMWEVDEAGGRFVWQDHDDTHELPLAALAARMLL